MKRKLPVTIIIIFILSIIIWLLCHKSEDNQIINEINNIQENNIKTDDKIPVELIDNGLFTEYYNLAYEEIKDLSLDEKIGQIFLVRYPQKNALEVTKNYNLGGYIFFEKDFIGKTKEQTIKMISEVQEASKIPMIIAVDEEGGTVVRISNNRNLTESKFKSPRELYLEGGFEAIEKDTIDKSKLLYELGINLNLAPVVDIATSSKDYMYNRTLGENTYLTATYGKTVIKASKGTGVSYCLKHFPGYGNNADTHKLTSKDTRTYESIVNNDLIPFKEGIKEGAEAVLISHNIVTSVDEDNPASLSKDVHKILRDDLRFTGVIITDDLAMAAANVQDATMKAVLAGNDFIIVSDYEKSINEVKNAINNGTISEDIIDKMAFKIIAWKYYKGLIQD